MYICNYRRQSSTENKLEIMENPGEKYTQNRKYFPRKRTGVESRREREERRRGKEETVTVELSYKLALSKEKHQNSLPTLTVASKIKKKVPLIPYIPPLSLSLVI